MSGQNEQKPILDGRELSEEQKKEMKPHINRAALPKAESFERGESNLDRWRRYQPTEEEQVYLDSWKSKMIKRAAIGGSGMLGLGALATRKLPMRWQKITVLSALGVIGMYGGAVTTIKAGLEGFMTLSNESPIKKDLALIILDWNPAYAQHYMNKRAAQAAESNGQTPPN